MFCVPYNCILQPCLFTCEQFSQMAAGLLGSSFLYVFAALATCILFMISVRFCVFFGYCEFWLSINQSINLFCQCIQLHGKTCL